MNTHVAADLLQLSEEVRRGVVVAALRLYRLNDQPRHRLARPRVLVKLRYHLSGRTRM